MEDNQFILHQLNIQFDPGCTKLERTPESEQGVLGAGAAGAAVSDNLQFRHDSSSKKAAPKGAA